MKFKDKEVTALSLSDLEMADLELASQEAKYNEAMKHSKFAKLKPSPTISPTFTALREEIKKQMELKRNG